MMRDERDSHEILALALEAAQADEADAVLVAVDQNISRFANSNLHQNMSAVSAELSLRVIVDGSMGVASTSSLDPDEIARTAALAREAAKHSDPLPNFTGLHRDTGDAPRLRTFDAPTAALSPKEKALSLRAMFDHGADAGVQFAGAYTTSVSSVACANTHGVRRYARITFADATVIALHPRGSGYATRCARRVDEVDIAALGEEATTKATLLIDRQQDLDPGAYDVILDPPAIAEVFEWMNLISFCGQSFEDGSSFLVGNIGKRMMGTNVTVSDDAVDEEFLPFPFDVEGFAKTRVPLIEHGVVKTPMVDKTYADRLGFAPNGGAWHLGGAEHGSAYHLAVEAGDAAREEMIASTGRGILVTRFNYVNGLLEPRSALMTGTTRDGTFLIENGRLVARLPNLRWTQSMLEAFSNVETLTRERRRVATWYNMFGGTIAPTMKIRGWNFTGKQESASV